MTTLCRISVTFVDKDGEEKLIKVPIGMSMLEAAHENDIELEGMHFRYLPLYHFVPKLMLLWVHLCFLMCSFCV
jgi:hypothetical protein